MNASAESVSVSGTGSEREFLKFCITYTSASPLEARLFENFMGLRTEWLKYEVEEWERGEISDDVADSQKGVKENIVED